VAPALLAAIPEAPAIAPPHIPGRGAPGPRALRGNPVGSVVAVARAEAGAFDYFVVLADGVQRVGDVTADLIRYTDALVGQAVPTVSADAVGGLPVVDTLPVTTYPRVGGVSPDRVVCASWRRDLSEGASHTEVLTAGAVPAAAVHLARADAEGPNIDAMSMPSGRSAYVRSVGLTGDGQSSGSLFLVSDSGALFGIHDDDAAKRLGMPGVAEPAPWPVLAMLPRGPELSRAGASVARDGFGATP
jgi:type VII secretion protein EccB